MAAIRSPSVSATLPQKFTAAAKPAPVTKPATTSSLDDSMFATSASSTPAASSAKAPRTPTPARRTVPLEKTAGFNSHAKAAHPKPIDKPGLSDERRREKTSEVPLLNIDQERAEAQVQNSLRSPGLEDLTGIAFAKPGAIMPPRSRSDVVRAIKAHIETPEIQGSHFSDIDLLVAHETNKFSKNEFSKNDE